MNTIVEDTIRTFHFQVEEAISAKVLTAVDGGELRWVVDHEADPDQFVAVLGLVPLHNAKAPVVIVYLDDAGNVDFECDEEWARS